MERKRKPLGQLSSSSSNDSPSSPKKKRQDIQQKRAGTITRVILKNFMCHSMLDVDLSCNTNLIIGRNGSGKSAILTAIIVGLGGKATLTNRGNSVRGFIKAGKTSGSVELQMYNGGPMAYRPKTYGDRIIITRHFTAAGSSSYKIKAENGKVVATQVREINNITTSLNIQVDNPVCILNQDTSRNFLSSNNPTHKFSLFVRATGLETLAEQYRLIVENKKESLHVLEEKQRHFRKLQTEVRDLKRKIDNHRSIVSIRDRLRVLQLEFVWAKVRDAHQDVTQHQTKVEGLEHQLQKVLEECETRAESAAQVKGNVAELGQQMAELRNTIQVQSRAQRDMERVVDELKAHINRKKTDTRLIKNTIKTKSKDAEVLRKEIKNVNEKMTEVELEKVQRARTLAEMTEKIKGMEEHLQTSRNDLYQLSSDIGRKDEEKQNLRAHIGQIDRQISNEKRSVTALKNESSNTLLLYGRDVPRVKQLIEQNRQRFTRVPLGPLGSYIKLKDKKWAVAAESTLGGLLSAFVIDNVKDNQLLLQIFNQVWSGERKPTIITSKFLNKRHDVTRNLVQAPPDCISLYDVLEIEDPVVANCLIDQASVEEVLLIPSETRAKQLLSNAASVPRNCKQGITVGGDKYYPDPNYRTYGCRNKRAQYLQVDTKEHIKQLEQNIRDLTEKKENAESQLKVMCEEMRHQEAEKAQLIEKIKKLDSARSKMRQQLEKLKATAEPWTMANIELLESELVEVGNIVKEKTAEVGRIADEMREIQLKMDESEAKLGQLKESNLSLEERMQSLEGQVSEINSRCREITVKNDFDKRRAKTIEEKLNECRSVLVVKQTTLKEFTVEASSVGERQTTARSVPEILEEMEQMERSVRRIEQNTENIEDLVEKYQVMHDRFTHLTTLLGSLGEDIKELNLAVENRKRHYKLTEEYFVTFIKHSFKKIMEVRQFEGEIRIDIQARKLELVVVPQHGSQGQTSTSNLSGGERSFSTVAFLLSLWQCMEFPFYILDEFDVYMDKLNRTKVIEILLHHAENHSDLQFVFLTPQDVSFVRKNISILRLQDPERSVIE